MMDYYRNMLKRNKRNRVTYSLCKYCRMVCCLLYYRCTHATTLWPNDTHSSLSINIAWFAHFMLISICWLLLQVTIFGSWFFAVFRTLLVDDVFVNGFQYMCVYNQSACSTSLSYKVCTCGCMDQGRWVGGLV